MISAFVIAIAPLCLNYTLVIKMRKSESDYDKTMKELRKALEAQNEQLARVQVAEERYKQGKDLIGYISFWEDIWQSGGLLFKGAFWTFRLADLYIKAKRYDDAIFFCQMIKTWDPDFAYKADKYIQRIAEKCPNLGDDRKEVMHMLRQKSETQIDDGANLGQTPAPQKPKKKKRWIAVIVILAIVLFWPFGKSEQEDSPVGGMSAELSGQQQTDVPEETKTTLTIVLTADEQGEYGEIMELNKGTEFEEVYYVYRVPAGTYTVTNIGEYMDQFNVYGDTPTKNEDGWEELPDVGCVKLLDVGTSDTVTIEDGYIIEIHSPAKFELVKQ